MRSGHFATDVVEGWLDAEAARAAWVGLMRDDPFAGTDPLAAEVGGSVYARAPLTLERIGTLLRSTVPLRFDALVPGTRAVALAGFDAPFNGSLRWVAYLPGEGRSWPGGGSFVLGARELVLGVDA